LRKGAKRPPDLIEPGEEYEYTIPLGNAGTIFRKGHRVRLEISSSSFPHYARNLNTGKNSNWTSDLAVASQTILPQRTAPFAARAYRRPRRARAVSGLSSPAARSQFGRAASADASPASLGRTFRPCGRRP